MKLEIAEALLAVGQLRREQIQAIAADLLEAGTDSPTVRELAGLTPVELDRAHELFHRLVSEMGHRLPTHGEAATTIARHIAALAVMPGANLRSLAADGARLAVALNFHRALTPFLAADDEYDCPGMWVRADVDERVLTYARSLLSDESSHVV